MHKIGSMGPLRGPGSKGSEGSERKVLKMDGPSAQGFLGLTGPLAPRVADCRSAAMLIKSALRDWLYESYSLIRITMMSHLRWLSPLWCLTAPSSPRCIGRATKGKRLYGQARRLTSPDLHILCRMCTVDNKAPQSNPFTQRIAKNKVPPPGGRWWRQPPKGVHFLARRAMSIIMPPFGGHVHIAYHNHSYPRTSLRHFVALFP